MRFWNTRLEIESVNNVKILTDDVEIVMNMVEGGKV